MIEKLLQFLPHHGRRIGFRADRVHSPQAQLFGDSQIRGAGNYDDGQTSMTAARSNTIDQLDSVHAGHMQIGHERRNVFGRIFEQFPGLLGAGRGDDPQAGDGTKDNLQSRSTRVRVFNDQYRLLHRLIIWYRFISNRAYACKRVVTLPAMFMLDCDQGKNRYPTPCTVRKWRGVLGSASSFWRSRTTCASTVRVLGKDS